jgi:putative flippase GtrA
MIPSPADHIRRLKVYSGNRYSQHAFLRFLIAGGVNTVFGYGIFCLAWWASGRSMIALITATILGTFFNFLTIGNLVFRRAKLHLLWRFVGVYAFVFLCNAVGLLTFERSGFAPILAQAILIPFIVVLSYFLNKIFVFGGARQSLR